MRYNIISESGRTYVTLSVEDWNKIIAMIDVAKRWKETHLSKDEIALFKAIDDLTEENDGN